MIGAFSEGDQIRRYLTDPAGNTLYYFLQDLPSEASCLNACASVWPPFEAVSINLPSSISAELLSAITREDELGQSAFKESPMYLFVNDQNRGDRIGTTVNDEFIILSDPLFLDEL